jgi:magnesium transporter
MEEGDKLWLLGMFMNISGSIMVNFGTNLMKSAHNIALETESIEDSEESEGNKKLFSSANLWKIGMSIFVIGSLVNFASFAFAAQSLLAALGTVQFISNVFFAKFILKEELTPRIMIATAIIIFGLTLAIIFSNHSTQLYTTQDLLDMYTPDYILFMTFVVVVMIVLHAVYMIYTVNEEVGTPLPGNHLIRPVTYALVSATVGTQSVLQSKCLAELIKATFEGVNQFDKPFVYIIVAIFAFGLSFWLYRMNAALKKFDGLLIIPLLQVFWTTSAIVQGGVYFQEFIKFTPTQTVGFLTGVGVVFVGVYLLTPQPRDPEDQLLPSDSSHSNVDTSTSSSSVPSTGFYQRRHGLGLGASHQRLSGQSEGEAMDMSTRSMVGLTCLPVIIETLPARHPHKTRGQSRHGMDNSTSSSSAAAGPSRDLELQSVTNQLHARAPPPASSSLQPLRLGQKYSLPPTE